MAVKATTLRMKQKTHALSGTVVAAGTTLNLTLNGNGEIPAKRVVIINQTALAADPANDVPLGIGFNGARAAELSPRVVPLVLEDARNGLWELDLYGPGVGSAAYCVICSY